MSSRLTSADPGRASYNTCALFQPSQVCVLFSLSFFFHSPVSTEYNFSCVHDRDESYTEGVRWFAEVDMGVRTGRF
jgi:hypothetical protein